MNSIAPESTPELEPIATPKILRPLERFLHIEAASGSLLIAAVIVALVWANWGESKSYEHFWHTPVVLQFGDFAFQKPLHFYINDVLMTVFFLVVGLEIRREMHEGSLVTLRLAALPLFAAAGGIAVPALVYIGFNSGGGTQQGWSIPTATDIAFAIGFLTLLGGRVPAGLRSLLLSIAIIDDIGAILIIAFFFSSGLNLTGLFIAGLGVAMVYLFQTLGVRTALPYILPGGILWLGILLAGVHPTIAGVALGLLTPVLAPVDRKTLLESATGMLERLRDRFANSEKGSEKMVPSLQQLKTMQREMVPPVVRVEAALHPWVAFGIMPLFALANAGVTLDGESLAALMAGGLGYGIFIGLVLGKPLGIVAAGIAAARLRIADMPEGVNLRGLVVIGCLGGIGFTMSIFLAQLALSDPQVLTTAKIAILIASATAALLGVVAGIMTLRRPPS